jgi:hypothetical protein
MKQPRRPAQDLRFAIECLPQRTRAAMLDGIESSNIIVGAYADRDGGVCPMLAAHRRGGRTNLVSFARAWDRYTRVGKRSRRATKREVHTLKTMLQASLVHDESVRGELSEAVAELQAIKARRAEEATDPDKDAPAERVAANGAVPAPLESANGHERPDTGERDRSDELGRRQGWAWLKVFRRYDEYEAALERLERAEREADRREVERRDLERV